jgi:pyruvate dehydrogenase E1 component
MPSTPSDPGSPPDTADQELQDWLSSLDDVIERGGGDRVGRLLLALQERAAVAGVPLPFSANTPYINTIPRDRQANFPGDREIERRIKSLVRWNAMAMVVRANREASGIGGHISTYASAATLLEIGFNHFFRGKDHPDGADLIMFQGHASPGIYARAFLDGRLSEEQLINFRRELKPGGLSSYPHPWLMPGFWEFPTVSMGLTALLAIYHARFTRYLRDRSLLEKSGRVWAFLGDGELDEPESLGAIGLAARERLDNLTFVINCNLQRLDGPVRGNGKVIQEMEAVFRGAGWRVIKVIWGEAWEPLLEKDEDGLLVRRMGEVVDGEYQKYVVSPGSYIREKFFGTDPRLLKMVENYSDDEIRKLRRGGHDPAKVYAAYHEAVHHSGSPVVILAKTIKGYGLGEAGEGKNITHSQKKMNEEELREFRSRFGIPISDTDVGEAPFYRPAEDSPELRYLNEHREALGGHLPGRAHLAPPLAATPTELFDEFCTGSGAKEASTTMMFVRMLAKMLRDKDIGRLIVPIVPDEARTFGMEALFRQVGIYSSQGQRYEPVDRETLLYYREATDGQILEEGITEAGAMSSFIAAGTAYANHGINTIPFFVFYSMFGFQRIGDLVWSAGDSRCRGFLVGATAGRTTLNGEGLQHQDGHSPVLAHTHSRVVTYDPAYAYELAVILRRGLQRMFVEGEDLIYYLTAYNEAYAMPPMPADSEDGILAGMYRVRPAGKGDAARKVRLLGSGPILNEVLSAAATLEAEHGVPAEVWSVTSCNELLREAVAVDRSNRLHPETPDETPYVRRCLGAGDGVTVFASDYLGTLPRALASWLPRPLVVLGTEGLGRSDTREALRDHFEVDHRHITLGALSGLTRAGLLPAEVTAAARAAMGIDPDKPDPASA